MIHRCKLTKLVYRDITPDDEDYEDAVEAGVTARTVEEEYDAELWEIRPVTISYDGKTITEMQGLVLVNNYFEMHPLHNIRIYEDKEA